MCRRNFVVGGVSEALATAVVGWVGQNFSLKAGIAIFGATYALGAIAIFIARAVFYRRDAVAEG